MSKEMPGRHYFEYYDITDPTPWYDEKEEYYDGATCPFCGETFERGDDVLEIEHREIGKDFFVVHERCLRERYSSVHDQNIVDDFLDEAGFEVRKGVLD